MRMVCKYFLQFTVLQNHSHFFEMTTTTASRMISIMDVFSKLFIFLIFI